MRAVVGALIGFALFVPTPSPACVGDCDGDGTVFIEELIAAVQIVLGAEPISGCAAADLDANGTLDISEIISAVDAALIGCPAVAPTPTATPDVVPTGCGDGTVAGEEECDDGNDAGGDGCDSSCLLEAGGNVCAGVPVSPGAAPRALLVTDALRNPVHITAPPLDPRRLFVIEQDGRIRIIKDGALIETPFLAIEDRVSCCGERGLLGLAFHPDFERNGRFFVNYTNNAGDTVVARYGLGADPDRADIDSEEILFTIEQPFSNHNGGQIAFGPDGYLYVGMGDGGGGGDPLEAGQDDGTTLGKLLRVDVDVEERPFHAVPPDNPRAGRGLPLGLIWAKGLRNPWRFSFDRANGDLYIADVGQGSIEEIDYQPGSSAGGENYGWDIFEGSSCFEPAPAPECPNPPLGFTPPVLEYGHSEGRCSVTGGHVYRGCALPDLHGLYFFADYCTPFMQSFRIVEGRVTELATRTAELAPGGGHSIANVSSFGEDARGELYIADYDGEIYKVVPAE